MSTQRLKAGLRAFWQKYGRRIRPQAGHAPPALEPTLAACKAETACAVDTTPLGIAQGLKSYIAAQLGLASHDQVVDGVYHSFLTAVTSNPSVSASWQYFMDLQQDAPQRGQAGQLDAITYRALCASKGLNQDLRVILSQAIAHQPVNDAEMDWLRWQ